LGTAFVYRFDGLTWSLEDQLFPSEAYGFIRFGGSVDVLDDVIIVGASSWPESTVPEAAYVYRYDSGVAFWLEEARLTPSDAGANDTFGYSVALGSDWAVVGAPTKSLSFDFDPGAVYVFVYDDLLETWSEFDKLTAADGAAGDSFGGSVTASRNVAGFPRRLAVGAPFIDEDGLVNTGAVYLFEWRIDGITPNGKLISHDAASGDELGRSVSLDGLTCAAGASGRDHLNGTNNGAVCVFRRTGEAPGDPWIEQMTLISATPEDFSRYGFAVGLSDPWLLIGAFNENGGRGAAYFVGGMGDCNDNGVADCADIFCETSSDVDGDATPDECATPCPGDLSGDGDVNSDDLFQLLGAWGACAACPQDLTGDGDVNSDDLFQLLGAWGACP
jgi:hypothetical protein